MQDERPSPHYFQGQSAEAGEREAKDEKGAQERREVGSGGRGGRGRRRGVGRDSRRSEEQHGEAGQQVGRGGQEERVLQPYHRQQEKAHQQRAGRGAEGVDPV